MLKGLVLCLNPHVFNWVWTKCEATWLTAVGEGEGEVSQPVVDERVTPGSIWLWYYDMFFDHTSMGAK